MSKSVITSLDENKSDKKTKYKKEIRKDTKMMTKRNFIVLVNN